MAQVLVYVVIDNRIHNYWFYGHELADVKFGAEEIGVALIQNNYNKQIYPCLLRIIPNLYGLCQSEHCSRYREKDGCQKNVDIIPRVCCGVAATEICPIFKLVFKIDAHVASCVATELQQCYKFRRRFLKYLKKHVHFKYVFQPSEGPFSEIFDGILEVHYVIEMQPLYPVQKIDFSWYYRIQELLIKKMHLEEAMAWLSTLGGAYSSLGDYFESHAVIAGKLSFQQLKVAMELADPITVARCKLFFALSLMQRGYLEKSKIIIRKQLKFAKKMELQDEKLVAMCRGLWAKFCYFKKFQCQAQGTLAKYSDEKTIENSKHVTDIDSVINRNHHGIIS